MLFSSMTFVFLFLPIVCGLYWLARREWRNYILLAASMLFYAWGEPRYLAIMLFTILINWGGALLVDRATRWRRATLTATILLDLGILGYFKYFNFLVDNFNAVSGMGVDAIKVIMPIGISFYTFQAISYVVDVYRRTVAPQRDIYKVALYICLFPQLIAGPIVKYHDVDNQISNRQETFAGVTYGTQRFVIGLSKKMLIANTLGAVADKIFALPVDQMSTSIAWLGAIAYRLQVFFDFSGYSDMAIGLGALFGFHFLENFNYPYICKSISEFWRRWHISLSTWFKEYLYFPLGGSRCGTMRTYMNLMLVFLATGLWHGAAWTFILWGMWNGAFMLFERATGWNKYKGGILVTIIQHIYAILAFVLAAVLFRSDTISYAWNYMKRMFWLGGEHTDKFTLGYYMDNIEWIVLVIAIVCSMPVFRHILAWGRTRPWRGWVLNGWLVTLFILCASQIAASTYNPFIYFRF